MGHTGDNIIEGNSGSDIIYGATDGNNERQFGDFKKLDLDADDSLIDYGGHDYLFGSSNLTGFQQLFGETYNDKIWSGDGVAGDLRVHGDNQTSSPLVEDPTGFNRNDGDDYIDIGDNNMEVKAYG